MTKSKLYSFENTNYLSNYLSYYINAVGIG